MIIKNKTGKWIVGKTFHKKEELLSKLFFNILKKCQKNRLLFCAPMDHLLLKYFFQKDKAEIIRISKIVKLLPSFIPKHMSCLCHSPYFIYSCRYVCLLFRMTDKYECSISLCWIKNLHWGKGKEEKVEFNQIAGTLFGKNGLMNFSQEIGFWNKFVYVFAWAWVESWAKCSRWLIFFPLKLSTVNFLPEDTCFYLRKLNSSSYFTYEDTPEQRHEVTNPREPELSVEHGRRQLESAPEGYFSWLHSMPRFPDAFTYTGLGTGEWTPQA